MQRLPAKSNRDRNMWFTITLTKRVGFGQVADRARRRSRFLLSVGFRLGHLHGLRSGSLQCFWWAQHKAMAFYFGESAFFRHQSRARNVPKLCPENDEAT